LLERCFDLAGGAWAFIDSVRGRFQWYFSNVSIRLFLSHSLVVGRYYFVRVSLLFLISARGIEHCILSKGYEPDTPHTRWARATTR
jgi:hypothetical protein